MGKTFIRKIDQKALAGKIVEVEAYDANDEASHSFNGKTKRNSVMFERGGLLYVYFIYGVHYCCNIVAGKVNHGAAVLIRAIEPLNHFETLASNRFNNTALTDKSLLNLTNGPAKICQAYKIGTLDNRINLNGDDIYILDAPKIEKAKMIQTTRVGISKSKNLQWRYYIKDNIFVSKK